MKREQNILILTYWPYNSALIATYTLPYVKIIRGIIPPENKIYLVTLTPGSRKDKKQFKDFEQSLEQKGIYLLDFSYTPFGLVMAGKLILMWFRLLSLCISKRINCIHAWCTPAGAIGYTLSRATGTTLVLDSFEPHALSMVETGTWKKTSLAFRLLFTFERFQLKRSKHVICAAQGMVEHSAKVYGIIKDNYFIKPACVDLELFKPREPSDRLRIPELSADSIVCVYAGKFGGIYLTSEVFEFFAVCKNYWGEKFKVLLLTDLPANEINNFCETAGVPFNTIIRRFVPHQEVPIYISMADFGLCPVKPVPTKKYCSPIKNGEYWAMGVPVVITRDISDDSDIIDQQNAGYVLRDLSKNEFLNAVTKIAQLIADPAHKIRIRKIAEEKRNFSIAQKIYETIYG